MELSSTYSELTPMLSPFNLRPIDNIYRLSEYRNSVGKMIHITPQFIWVNVGIDEKVVKGWLLWSQKLKKPMQGTLDNSSR